MQLIAGVDEAGRGALAGPVVSAAVILSPDSNVIGIRDSKKLTEKKRELLFEEILSNAISVGIGVVHEHDIEDINILRSTYKSMRLALGRLSPQPQEALIDGFSLPDQIVKNKGVIRGDDKVLEISAASIIAKVTRDRIMRNYSIVFPEYSFDKHKGYGTKVHISALKEYLACPIHRKTFHPVTNFIPSLSNILETDRINKWSLGLACRELIRKDHKVLEIKKNDSLFKYIDIVSQKSNLVIYSRVKVFLDGYSENCDLSLNNSESRKIKKEINSYHLTQNPNSNYQIDIISIFFGSGSPIVKHRKNFL